MYRDETFGFDWIWHSDYYDGPLSGAVRLDDGRRAWAQVETDPDPNYRRFVVYDLTETQWAILDEQHADFERLVGTHTNWTYTDGQGSRVWGAVHGTAEQRAEFYAKWPPDARESREQYRARPVLGEVRVLWYGFDGDDEEEV